MKDKALPRILPFAVFMSFIGVTEVVIYLRDSGLLLLKTYSFVYIYPLKTFVVSCILVYFWKSYREIRWRDFSNIKMSFISILAGLTIFALWINLDYSFATHGPSTGFHPDQFKTDTLKVLMIATRFAGAVIIVPIMEELFWRSFLIRYVITSDFNRTTIGHFTWTSFITTIVLFGLEHHYILAGIMAGIIFNLLLYYTKSIFQCILSHAVANLALGYYVLQSGEFRFW